MDDGRPRLSVSTRSGRVRVEARPGADFHVRGAQVERDADGSVRVVAGSGGSERVEVVCPAHTHVIVGTASGRVDCFGPLGDVRVTTRSGRVTIEEATSVDVRTSSGAVEIGRCTGDCRAVTTSSRISVGTAHALDCSTTSGRIGVGAVHDAKVRTVSGRIGIGTQGTGEVDVTSISGKVEVSVAADREPDLQLHSTSGHVRCQCRPGDDGAVRVATTSGSINVVCR
jgi:DUF4097 and DUF4098 domain-containing protein YvlB